MNFNAKPKFRWPAKFILISSLQRKFTTSSPFKDKVRQSTLTQAAALSVLQERHHCAQLANYPTPSQGHFLLQLWGMMGNTSRVPAFNLARFFYSWKMRGRAWRTPCCSITASKCCLPLKVLTLEQAKSQGTLLPSRGQADSCLLSASSRSKSLNKKSLTKKKGKKWSLTSPES